MALFIWLLIGCTIVIQGQGQDLKWPPEYTVKGTKMSLTSNIIEHMQMWQTKTKTRVDYNDGAVSSIEKLDKSLLFYRKYDIHPEAFLNQSSHTVCYVSSHNGTLGDILPETRDFTYIDEEEMKDEHTVKYKHDRVLAEARIDETLWAIYDCNKTYWYPFRYEIINFNTKLGFKEVHEIWEYSGFSTNFSKADAFNLGNYDCETKKVIMDVVTKAIASIDPEEDDRMFKTTSEEMKNTDLIREKLAGKSGKVPFPYTQSKLTELAKDLPREYDLRLYGLVSTVKGAKTDEDECRSSWTFAATAAVEGALARVNGGRLLYLANQALIDCAWAFNVFGCDGGTDVGAYEWMMEYGLPTVAEYGTFKNRNGICNIKNMKQLYPIRGYTAVTPRSVEALKIALINHGPVTVSVHATLSFKNYESGIFYDPHCNETKLTHQMTLVGYGESYGETFWILKNSWGPNWGIDGYMHISVKDNVCGVATEPTFVVF